MKLSGWIFMIISWTFILSLAIFCFSQIFKRGLGGDGVEKPKRISNRKRRAG